MSSPSHRPRVKLTRTARFSAAHRYLRPEWSEARNREVFGANVDPHGHNYLVEVTLAGQVDPETGMAVDLSLIDDLLEREVTSQLGQRDLSQGVAGLEGQIPTTENLSVLVWRRLHAALGAEARLERVRVYESPELFVDYEGEPS